MTTAVEPLPGDFFATVMPGPVGWLIRVGQWLLGKGFRKWSHAGVYLGGGKILEAEVGGARETDLSEYDGRPMAWSTGKIPLTDGQRAAIVAAARGYKGVPYSFVDDLAMAAHRFHLPGGPWLRRYVQSTKHMLCSALVDQCYQDAGVQLFDDRRWNGYVTPADLDTLIR